MNEQKLNSLLKGAQAERPPVPPTDLNHRVLRAIHDRSHPNPSPSVVDCLDRLFPQLVLASLALIALCAVGELCLGALHLPTIGEGTALISNQWLLTTTGI